ncbi:MAG: MarR family winged helix-turn-helix transcriptional regulator [Ktedonobacterales bacterium]
MAELLDETDKEAREHRQTLADRLQFLGQMASTETALFHQAAAARYGLGITDMKTLSALQQEGSMTAGQLAKRLSLTTGAVTNVIDRLERQNFVKRVPDARDRRKVIVTINQEKLDAGENVYLSMGEAFSKLLENYSTEQLEFLVRFYEASIELTKREIAKLAGNEAWSQLKM